MSFIGNETKRQSSRKLSGLNSSFSDVSSTDAMEEDEVDVYGTIKSERHFRENHGNYTKNDKITTLVEHFINENEEDNNIDAKMCVNILKAVRISCIYDNEVSKANMDILTPLEVNETINGKSDSSIVISCLENMSNQINSGIKIPNLNFDHESNKTEYLGTHDYNLSIVEFDSDENEEEEEETDESPPVNILNVPYQIIKPSNVPPYIQTVLNFSTSDDPYLHFSIDAIHGNKADEDSGELFGDENEIDIFPDGVRGLNENIVDINLTTDSLYNIVAITQEKHPDADIDDIIYNVHFLFPKLGSLTVLKDVINDAENQLGELIDPKAHEKKQSFMDLWCNNCCKFMDCACEKKKVKSIPAAYVNQVPFDDDEFVNMCGVDCYKNSSNKKEKVESFYEYTELERLRFKQYYSLFGNRSCQIKDALITDEGVAVKCYRIKNFIDKYCKNKPTKQYIKMTTNQQTPNTYQTFANVARKTILKNDTEYGNNDKYTPCRHVGECSEKNKCPCIKSKHACFNLCGCPPSCPTKFTGCNCKSGNCNTTKCPCVKLGWECVSTFCKSCCCDVTVEVPLKDMCRNSFLQRGFSKRLDIRESTIAGYGAFAMDNIDKGEFISEYKGEIISKEESERRGRVYDSIKISYLFKLNQMQQVDAYHYGNACRFINHSDTNANVAAKIVVISGMQRIALYASKNITAGEELFFNYNYSKNQTKNFVENGSLPGKKIFHKTPYIGKRR
uniref:[Histone H3]-lysine(27) N-trimethyltransferase n=1 Tax=Parastrongyloides trichosuri TaxID=131310 RepID=A0A0N4ZL85_PARTI